MVDPLPPLAVETSNILVQGGLFRDYAFPVGWGFDGAQPTGRQGKPVRV